MTDLAEPHDFSERVGRWSEWMMLAGFGLLAVSLRVLGACSGNDRFCIGGSAVLLISALAALAVAVWSNRPGLELELRRQSVAAREITFDHVRAGAGAVARVLEDPQRPPTVWRSGDDDRAPWQPLHGMQCPRCGSDTVWAGEVTKWWCLREQRHV